MTFEALEAEVVRQRKLYADDPIEHRVEILRNIRNRAALIERFFALGASATLNHNENVLPDGSFEQAAIAMALEDMAHEIVIAAQWMDDTSNELEPGKQAVRQAVRR